MKTTLTQHALLLALGGLAGYLGGAVAAAVVLAVGLVLHGLWHAWNLSRLLHWLALPRNRSLPLGIGRWGRVFDRLSRFAREEQDARDEMGAELERVRAAVHRMPDSLIVLDRWNHIEWFNRPAETLHGIVGLRRPIHHFVRDPEFGAWLDAGARNALEIDLPHHPGRHYVLQMYPAGDTHRLLITHDVTEQRRLDAMRRDFVANVSHEIRTPLTVIAGFVETMLDLDLDDASRRQYLESILKQTGTMRRLIEDLLTLSKLEHDAPRSDDEAVDLHELLDGLLADARALSAGRHEVTLALEGPRLVRASAMDLQTAIRNLLTNAVRYTPDGGRVSVEWRMRGSDGWLGVRDTGIGIPAEHLPRLTERFYRVDRGRSRDTGGTGLGLAIVKHVVQRHQAVLEIRSRPGQGSQFVIRWPAARILPDPAREPVTDRALASPAASAGAATPAPRPDEARADRNGSTEAG